MGARAWPGGGGLGLARVRVSRVRASRVRVLAQREAAQTAGTCPRSKGPPCGMPSRCRRPSGSQGPAGGRRVRVS